MVDTTIVGYVPVNKAGDTMTGVLVLSGDPVAALQAATKQYVDATSSGLDFKESCVAGSTADLNAVYANGAAGIGATLTNNGAFAAFAVDGISPNLNDRILVKNQINTEENGIYDLTVVGDGITAWVLTRSDDYDQVAEIKPGNFVIVEQGTVNAVTSWVQTATVAVIGTDPILFSQFSASPTAFANLGLSNLSAVAINESLISDTDVTDDLGSQAIRWRNIYAQSLGTGDTAGDQLFIRGWDTGTLGYGSFMTITAGNPPTGTLSGTVVLNDGVTATTQPPNTNDLTVATTAYADAAAAGVSGANTALSNLAAVQVNTDIVPDTDLFYDLGSVAARWLNVYTGAVLAGDNNLDTLLIGAWNSTTSALIPFINMTSGNPPTCNITGTVVLDDGVTATTQFPGTNDTTVATTAYVDAAVTAGGGANTSLSNLAATQVNTDIIPDTDVTHDLGTDTARWDTIHSQYLRAGSSFADFLFIGGYNSTTAAFQSFISIVSADPPTCFIHGTTVLSNGVTATTQTPNTNNLTVATTEYVDTAVAAAGGGGSWVHLATATAASSATVDFTAAIDGTYDMYVVKVNYLLTATNATTLWMRLRSGGVFRSTAGDYGWGFSSLTIGSSSNSDAQIQACPTGYLSNIATKGLSGLFYLSDPSSTTKHKLVFGNASFTATGATLAYNLSSGGILNAVTTAVDGIRFMVSSGNIASGRFDLYGINN